MKRKSNIELLRIISIIMILLFHAVYKNEYIYQNNIEGTIIKSFFFLGELGVNVFILISGYFMINSKFKIEKVKKLILSSIFYYYGSLLICYKLGIVAPQTKIEIFKLLFIRPFDVYWFVVIYIIIYILSPYINKLIKSLTKTELEKLIIILINIFSLTPTVIGLLYNNSEFMINYNRLIWLIIIYMIGAYQKLYTEKADLKQEILKLTTIFFLMITSILLIYYNQTFFGKIGTKELAYLWTPNNIFMLILSISLFKTFLATNINENKIINTIATTTLGIYMIHDGLLSQTIWNIFKLKEKINLDGALFYILFTVTLIFIVTCMIDIIRQKVENFIEKRLINKCKIIKKINAGLYCDILKKVIL